MNYSGRDLPAPEMDHFFQMADLQRMDAQKREIGHTISGKDNCEDNSFPQAINGIHVMKLIYNLYQWEHGV